jgi:tetratricopeptide (TPR) repeat protein
MNGINAAIGNDGGAMLDEPVLPWHDERLQRLHQCLVEAYNTPALAEELVEQAGPELPYTIEWSGNMRAIWRSILNTAARQGRLRTLLAKAVADPLAAAFSDRIAAAVDACTPASAATAPASGGNEGTPIIDRDEEQANLLRALTGDGPNIVVVTGATGVGKSKLVQTVVADLKRQPGGPRICWHELAPTEGLALKTLIDDIERGRPLSPRRRRESLLTRLEAALEGPGLSPLLIVIDAAEQLFTVGTDTPLGLDLDEGFEVLSRSRHTRVKVVLITQTPPVSPRNGGWPSAAEPVNVSGLRFDDYAAFIRSLDHRDRAGLLTSPERLDNLTWQLRGNPRFAELLYAVLCGSARDVDIDDLSEDLAALDHGEIAEFLTGELICGLHPDHRAVVEALAAFGALVTPEAVFELLRQRLSLSAVNDALRNLVEHHVVRRVVRQEPPAVWYTVPSTDTDRMLAHLPEFGEDGRLRLLHRAANVLTPLRTRDVDVVTLADLRVHFMELAVLLRARLYEAAFGQIRQMDEFLVRWNCTYLLLSQRLALQGHLESEDANLSNYNAIGIDYVALGQFAEAAQSFDSAAQRVGFSKDPSVPQKLWINRAAMHWEQGNTREAAKLYKRALKHDFSDPEDEAAALDGLADCHRRWGDYMKALELSERARSGAAFVESSLAISICLKQARWHAELRRFNDAARLLRAAREAALRRPEISAWEPACLDAQADLHLWEARPRQAVETAAEAIDVASAQHDPVVLMQARTTQCLAYLFQDDPVEAVRAIEPAEAYRRPGRSLIVLALAGLATGRRRNRGKAAAYFDRLFDEAHIRLKHDLQDFGAWDMKGLALCHRYLDQDNDVEPALTAFRTAHSLAPHGTALAGRLVFLVQEIERCGRRRDQFQPVIELLRTRAGQ